MPVLLLKSFAVMLNMYVCSWFEHAAYPLFLYIQPFLKMTDMCHLHVGLGGFRQHKVRDACLCIVCIVDTVKHMAAMCEYGLPSAFTRSTV